MYTKAVRLMFRNALVTGGAGFIGSHLSKALLEKELKVTVVDNLSTGRVENIPENANFIEGDILNTKRMKNILMEHEIDIIFHEAAKVSVRDSLAEFPKDAETNVMGTISVLHSCVDSQVRKIIYASSMAVYADSENPKPVAEDHVLNPISPYGISKLACEKYMQLLAEEMGISCTVLRYFNTYGIGQQYSPYVGVLTIFIHRLLEGSPLLIYGDGDQRRDFIHVSDVVRANILAMEKDDQSQIFNIGTGKATSVNELADIVCEKIDPTAEIQHIDEHRGELKNSVADITKAKNYLGFEPSKSMKESTDEIIEWIKAAGLPKN